MPKMVYAYNAKHNMPEMFLFFFCLQYYNGYTKYHQFDKFFKKCTLICQQLQYSLNKIVSNKVKDK